MSRPPENSKCQLSEETPLPAEFDRVAHLMEELKRMGMSNPEIVELTDGRWGLIDLQGKYEGR